MSLDLGELLKQQNVPKMGTRESIQYIDLSMLQSDERNFYQLSDIEGLAANIELIGLQQPIRVRKMEDGYRIVSGHRRRAAIQKLADEGKTEFQKVACIVESVECSEAMQELRLIYANSDTRKMSSADLARQAERVEALLYQLKEEGYEFPGRMRDHVAQACQTTKSKLSRLKVIREKLAAVWTPYYERSELNEACAYALAQLSEDWQRKIYTAKMSKNPDLKYFYQSTVEVRRDYLAALEKLECEKCGGFCQNADGKFNHMSNAMYSYDNCHKKCCDKCENLSKCKNACPLLAEKVKKLKSDKKEAKRQAELAQKAAEEPKVKLMSDLWLRFGIARAAAKLSVKDFRQSIGSHYYGVSDEREFREKENCENISAASSLPYGYNFDYLNAKRLIDAADTLGVSLDYLFCRSDLPQPTVSAPAGTWMLADVTPEKPCDVVAKFDFGDGTLHKSFCYWDGYVWRFSRRGEPTEMRPAKWLAIPDDEEGGAC